MALPTSTEITYDNSVKIKYNGVSTSNGLSSSYDISVLIKDFKDSFPVPDIIAINPIKAGSKFEAFVSYGIPGRVEFTSTFDHVELSAISQDITNLTTLISVDVRRASDTGITYYITKTYKGKLVFASNSARTSSGVSEVTFNLLPNYIQIKKGNSPNSGTEVYRYEKPNVWVFGTIVSQL